jgi:hypothetical protein
MKIFDKKSIILNDGIRNIEVLVYLKEVKVRNDHTNMKAFCKIVGGKLNAL